MTKQNEVYKCEICGNIITVLHSGSGQLVCCNEPMILLEEKTQDPEKGEKHVPIITKTENGILIKVGAIEHPMEQEHYIEFIQIIMGGKIYTKFLNPGDKPEAEFCITELENIIAREYCNLHGLWRSI